jgi:hypothetical protein
LGFPRLDRHHYIFYGQDYGIIFSEKSHKTSMAIFGTALMIVLGILFSAITSGANQSHGKYLQKFGL